MNHGESSIVSDKNYHPNGHCFIAHQLSKGKIDDFRRVVEAVLEPLGYLPDYLDRSVESQSLLFKICQKIFMARFSIFDLSDLDPDVCIEVGIALAFDRPIVITVQQGSAHTPFWVKGPNVVFFEDYQELKEKLSSHLPGFISNYVSNPASPGFCSFCHKICDGFFSPPDENLFLILNRKTTLLERMTISWRDVRDTIDTFFDAYSFYSTALTEIDARQWLCELRRKVFEARFSVGHLGKKADETSLLALGMVIGSRTPWFLINDKDLTIEIPALLQGFDQISYESLRDLEIKLEYSLKEFLQHIAPTLSREKRDTEMLRSIPFWIQLDDWIDSASDTPDSENNFTNSELYIIQYSSHSTISSKFPIPKSGLLIGRDPSCHVVVNYFAVSAQHFRIIRNKKGQYYIEDLNSDNGTFLNGKRVEAKKMLRVYSGNTIRIPFAKFIIWQGTSLPQNLDQKKPQNTQTLLSHHIELEDEFPPHNVKDLDNVFIIPLCIYPDGTPSYHFEVQSYYSLKKVLREIVRFLKLSSEDEYCLTINENQLVNENENCLRLIIREGTVFHLVPVKAYVINVISSLPGITIDVPSIDNASIDGLVKRRLIDGRIEKTALMIRKTIVETTNLTLIMDRGKTYVELGLADQYLIVVLSNISDMLRASLRSLMSSVMELSEFILLVQEGDSLKRSNATESKAGELRASLANHKTSISPLIKLSDHLYNKLRQALLTCGPFETDRHLRSIFSHPNLSPWRNKLPESSSIEQRVDQTIDFLLSQHSHSGQLAVFTFLQILIERDDPENDCSHILNDIAGEISDHLKDPTKD